MLTLLTGKPGNGKGVYLLDKLLAEYPNSPGTSRFGETLPTAPGPLRISDQEDIRGYLALGETDVILTLP